MKGVFLRFYVEENRQHDGILLWEWLLARASALGLRGGTAIKAMGGFGRHRDVHESRFFELAGSTGVEIEFVVTEDESQQLLDLVRDQNIRLFYALIPATFGVINPASGEEVCVSDDL